MDTEVGAFRERLYPPLTTLGLFIEQSLSADGACQDAVARYLSARTTREQAPCSLNTDPYCKARPRSDSYHVGKDYRYSAAALLVTMQLLLTVLLSQCPVL